MACQNAKDVGKIGVIRSREGDSEIENRVLHVVLNLTSGHLVAKKLSKLIRDVIRSGVYTADDLIDKFCMHPDEMDLLLDGDLLKVKKVPEHKYSSAWVPVEAANPTKGVSNAPQIERPPNADR